MVVFYGYTKPTMPAPVKDQNMQTGNFRGFTLAIVILAAAFGVLAYAAYQPVNQPQVAGIVTEIKKAFPGVPLTAIDPSVPADFYPVESVVDGDTIRVAIAGSLETVRLIGIDTSETKDPRKPVQCFGNEASNYTSAILSGKYVRLEPDSTQQDRDKYGRLLRYVYLQDGSFFNLQIIAAGYAYEYTYKVPYLFQQDFKTAQATAATAGIGLWNSATCNGKK